MSGLERKISVSGVGALIHTADGRYLMQLRDDLPEVSMRGYWGLFGGRIEDGEKPCEALMRELREELGVIVQVHAEAFSEIRYSLEFASSGIHRKLYFEVPIDEGAIGKLRLYEGERMALHTPEELTVLQNVIPWDLFGVLLHARRQRLREVIIRTPDNC